MSALIQVWSFDIRFISPDWVLIGFYQNLQEYCHYREKSFDVFFLFKISVSAISDLQVNTKKENLKRKNKHVLTLSELSITLKHSGRHMALSCLVSLSFSSLRNLDIESNEC